MPGELIGASELTTDKQRELYQLRWQQRCLAVAGDCTAEVPWSVTAENSFLKWKNGTLETHT